MVKKVEKSPEKSKIVEVKKTEVKIDSVNEKIDEVDEVKVDSIKEELTRNPVMLHQAQ